MRKFEYKAVETGMRFETEETGSAPMAAMTPESTRTFIALLIGLPHGVSAMSQEIPDLVETSDNLAIVKTMEDKATFYLSTRSSIPSALRQSAPSRPPRSRPSRRSWAGRRSAFKPWRKASTGARSRRSGDTARATATPTA